MKTIFLELHEARHGYYAARNVRMARKYHAYIRWLMKQLFSTPGAFFDEAVDSVVNTALLNEVPRGKSRIMRKIAEERDLPLVDLKVCTSCDPDDYTSLIPTLNKPDNPGE